MTQRASPTSEAAVGAVAARNDSLACLLSSSQIRRRRARAVQILIVIACVMLCGELFMSQVHTALHEWSSWMVQLVFPSQNVTSVKVACLVSGFALTFYYLVVSDSHEQFSTRTTTRGIASPRSSSPRNNKGQSSTGDARATHHPTNLPPRISEARTPAPTTTTAQQQISRGPTPLPQISEPELPQIKLANEHQSSGISSNSSSSDPALHVNKKEPIAFENDLFQGHLLFMVWDSTLSSNRKANPNLKTNWSHLFNGRKRALWVQVQGRFKRVPPPDATLYLAAEVASPLVLGFWTRKLVEVLVSIMKKIARNVHISFGDDDSDGNEGGGSELAHAAFPLYQCVDEFVETPLTKHPPMLGIENFGESPQQKEQRMRPSSASSSNTKKEFALDKVYTFQFYTMYADLAQWQIANLPGMPEIPLKKLTGDQPIRFAAYMVSPTAAQPPTGNAGSVLKHANAAKDYLFCYSLQYNEANKRPRGNSHHQSTNSISSSTPTTASADQSSVLCSPTASSLRSTLVASPRRPPGSNEELESEATAATPVSPTVSATAAASPPLPSKLVQHEQALRNLQFALPMWVEQVDRIAGNRKVSYLFTVEETTSAGSNGTDSSIQLTSHRYTVVRSAATIKNALLMLRDDNVDITTTSGGLKSDKSKGATSSTTSHRQPKFNRSHEEEFRKLLVESREFLYETITNETQALADALQKIADVSGSTITTSSSPCRLDKLKRAMLYHCLKSSGSLASVRAYQDIGIQLSKAKRERMDIICECGAYRVHSPRMLRQEWLMLTTSDVLFFRSYSMRACKTVAIAELLRVQSVDAPHVLNPQGDDTNVSSAQKQPNSSWYCVELHLMCEIVTLFLDSEDMRKQFVASLNQMLRLTAKPGRLPPPRTFESQPLPLCLNQRNMLRSSSSSMGFALGFSSPPPSTSYATKPLALVQEVLRKGIELYEMPVCDRKPSDLLPFLDAVELLSDMDLPHEDDDAPVSPLVLHAHPRSSSSSLTAVLPFSHEEKLAFALNLYHVLYIHATLVFGAPSSQFQWKKLQSVPFYLIGKHKTKQVRLTLEVIEHEMLRAGAVALSTATSLSTATAGILSPGASARKLLQLGSGKTGAGGSNNTTGGVGDLALPKHLATTRSDFRTTFALQMNCNPSGEKHVVRVYDGTEKIHEQLNETSSLFLAQELRVDLTERVIWLPKVVERRQQDFLPRSGKSVAMGLIGANGNGGTGDPRAFYCLQKILGFLEETQRDQVQNVLLGVGKSARIVYDSFWTQSVGGNTSGAVVLKRSTSSQSPDHALAKMNSRDSSKNVVEIGSYDTAAATPTSSGAGTSARQFFQSFF